MRLKSHLYRDDLQHLDISIILVNVNFYELNHWGPESVITKIHARLVNAVSESVQANARVLIIETCSPQGSQAIAERLQTEFPRSLVTDCRRQLLQPFAGLSGLVEQAFQIAEEAGQGALAAPHWIELPLLAPSLQAKIEPRRPEACFEYTPGEKRRRAGPEWTRRCFHGTIDLLFALQAALGQTPLIIGLLNLDQAGPEVREFYALLLRRAKGRPVLIWATTGGSGGALAEAATALDLPFSRVTAGDGADEIANPLPGAPRSVAGQPPTASPDEPSVAELVAAADHYAYHGPWREIVELCQLALIRMTEADRPHLPTLLSVMRVALNGINQFPAAEQLLLQQLALTANREERVICLYHLTILHSLWQDNLDRAAFYQAEAFRAVETAQSPAERAELMIYAVHSALIVWGRQGQLERALAEGERAIADFLAHWAPERQRVQQAILLYGIAQAAEALGKDELAVDYFRRSLAADPHFPEYYHHYAAALNRLDRYSEALAVCQEAWERTPPYHWLAMCRGRALHGLGRLQEALADFNRAIELEPAIPEHHLSRALLLHEIGDLPEAIQGYTAYLTLRPDDPEALANRGSARHDTGDLPGGLADLDRAVELRPTLVAAWANRAALLADLGRLAEAQASLERALALDPANEMLLQNRDALAALAAG